MSHTAVKHSEDVPRDACSCKVCASGSATASSATMCAPSLAKKRTAARPKLPPAPVIQMTLPSNLQQPSRAVGDSADRRDHVREGNLLRCGCLPSHPLAIFRKNLVHTAMDSTLSPRELFALLSPSCLMTSAVVAFGFMYIDLCVPSLVPSSPSAGVFSAGRDGRDRRPQSVCSRTSPRHLRAISPCSRFSR